MFLRRAEKGIQSMAREDNLYELPEGLPIPVDDGASDHLPGTRLPSVPLRSTAGNGVDLASLTGRTVVYCYPRMSRPDKEMPQDWDEIPGARGCTPQSCAFRDHHAELRSLGARVFGLSKVQNTSGRRPSGSAYRSSSSATRSWLLRRHWVCRCSEPRASPCSRDSHSSSTTGESRRSSILCSRPTKTRRKLSNGFRRTPWRPLEHPDNERRYRLVRKGASYPRWQGRK